MNRTKSWMSRTVLAGALLLSAGAWADDGRPPPPAEARAHMAQMCKAEPQKCEEMKKHVEAAREACKKDPEACKQKREEMRQKMKERCDAEPQKCEEWKKKHHAREEGKGDHPAPPPPADKK